MHTEEITRKSLKYDDSMLMFAFALEVVYCYGITEERIGSLFFFYRQKK